MLEPARAWRHHGWPNSPTSDGHELLRSFKATGLRFRQYLSFARLGLCPFMRYSWIMSLPAV